MTVNDMEVEITYLRKQVAKLNLQVKDLDLIVESIDSATMVSEMGRLHEIDDALTRDEILDLIQDDS